MRKVTRAKGNIKGRRAIIEAIEQRILLSTVVSNGVLTITGTSAADTINLNFTINGIYTATVNGVGTVFQGDGIGQVVVNGLGGNDNIKIIGSDEDDASSPAPLNIAVNEGDGNDGINTSITGTGSTSPITVNITAGNGNDNIFVQGGSAATVTAGNGNDTLSASANNAELVANFHAGNGNDQINGVSAGDASLQLQAVVGTGHDTFNNNNDPDISLPASTSDGQSPGAVGGFVDFTGVVSESTSAGLKPLADATVFVDTNNNGILDPGELSTITDLSGDYNLGFVPSNGGDPTTYDVRVIEPGYTSTPLVRSEHAQPGEGFSGEDFTFPTITTATATNPTLFGTAGSYNNQGNTIANAVDGNLSTFFDSPTASGGFVALDYGLPQTIKQISFAPRSTLPGRMVGGLFQGSNSADFSGAVTLYTVTTAPAVNKLTTVNVSNTGAYRYVRYLGPANSYSNIAEMKFTIATNLTGTAIGTAGSYHSQGNTAAHAFDGNLSTFFDAPDASGDWAGLDLGTAKIITQISYAPRSGWASRMVGGMFQASNSADFSSGVATLYTVTAVPATGVLTTVQIVNFSAYRFVRYIGPANSYSNIAEGQFSGSAAVSGTFLQSRGTLVIDGTSNADTITLDVASVDTSEPNPDTVTATVNGVVQTFPLADVLQIVINAGAGNDTVTLTGFDEGPNDITGHGYEAITVNGGDGNDTITNNIMVQDISIGEPLLIDGGGGDDTIFDGGDGIATIIGGDGNDTFGSEGFPGLIVSIYGGDGNDTVFADGDTRLAVYDGGTGMNTLDLSHNATPTSEFQDIDMNQFVNVHNIVLSAGEGDLTVTGTPGDDTITDLNAGEDDVSIIGGGGNDVDSINGANAVTIDDSGPGANIITVHNSGAVSVTGGNGNDIINVRGNTTESVDGGPGFDTAFADPGARIVNVESLNPDLSAALTGTVIGTTGSYHSQGNTAAHAFDGNLNTFFDAPDASGDWAGLDLGTPKIVTQISYAPRAGFADRMVGGMFQASNSADFSSGVVTLYTVASAPSTGVLTTVQISNSSAYRYVRYIGQANGYSNVAEVQFAGATPVAFVQSDGTLVVDGTSGDDNISVDVNVVLGSILSNTGTIVVTVNGLKGTFDAAGIHGLLVNSFDGNDQVVVEGSAVDGSPTSMFPVSIVAGNGNDAIEDVLATGSDFGVGGTYMGQSASITAGNGNDMLEIDGTGLATILAGNGNDQFTSMDNGDEGLSVTMTAGNGSDTFTTGSSGGSGLQFVGITAGTGRDYVRNEDPDDIDTGTLGGQTFSIGWQQELLTGKVYVDTNGNGQFDPGEPVVANAPVSFQNSFDGTVSTTTDSNGNYSLMVNFDQSGDTNSPITQIGPYSITLTAGELAGGLNIAVPAHAKLTGTVIGTPGSYRNHGTTIANVFDNNLATFFDAPDASGDWVGLDLGSPQVVTQVKYAPRAGWESRMVGGEIQASNTADFSSGVVTLLTISSTPTAGALTTQSLANTTAYRYYRYIGPANSYCDIAELEFDS